MSGVEEFERQLTEVLRDFARTMVSDFAVQSILDNLAKQVARTLPVASVGVLLSSSGDGERYAAASDARARRVEAVQLSLDEGPCLTASRTGDMVEVPDLCDDPRFPRFADAARADGVAAVFAFPLHHGAERLGALGLYRTEAGPLDPAVAAAAQTLADVASAYVVTGRDRGRLRDASERFRLGALHDRLTGLPNRVLLAERIEHCLRRDGRSGAVTAVLLVGLDRFKVLNDDFGHEVGDQILVAVAGRLVGALRPGDTVARLASDEFVVLCEDLTPGPSAEDIATRVQEALAPPLQVGSLTVSLSAAIGIAVSGAGADSPGNLLADADVALRCAKRSGGGRQHVLSDDDRELARQRSGLERELRDAERRGELVLHYQPVVTTTDGGVVGLEALLRWRHPSKGLIPPDLIIPVAERTGLINPIGAWVLTTACTELNHWQKARSVTGHGRLGVAVNVSAHQLTAANFVPDVERILAASGTDPATVTLEVTETVFLRDSDAALAALRGLKALGVSLALDDFGTGFSSLSYLQHFPFDVVKIDRGFVSQLGTDTDTATDTIVSSVVRLAHGLGMAVIAEGVETDDQRVRLEALGCDCCQGFLFARPLDAERTTALIGSGARSQQTGSSESATPPPTRTHPVRT